MTHTRPGHHPSRATTPPSGGGRAHARAGAATLLAAAAALLQTPSPAPAQDIMPEPRAPIPAELADRHVVLITGSTGGLGREVALALAAEGWHVIAHGRDRDRGHQVVEEVRSAGGTAAFYGADLASIDEVGRLGEAILRDYDRLDVLVNNAGIWLSGDDRRRVSTDGHERSFAVNYLAGFQLTRALLPLLRRSAPARVVNVASAAQSPIDFDDVMMTSGYSGSRAYGQSKLAQILHAFDLAERLTGSDVRVNALHPATLMDTDMVRDAGVRPRSTVEEGRDAVLQLVRSPDVGTGEYYDGLRRSRAHAQAYDADARARLRALSERLIGG